MKKSIILFIALMMVVPFTGQAASLAAQQSGKILLQVEANGEAWYVNPTNQNRYYMGRPNDAFNLMRDLGLGISTENLNKLPIGYLPLSGNDTDMDGLSDIFEDAQGTSVTDVDTDSDGISDLDEIKNNTNPLVAGTSTETIDYHLRTNMRGRILLQVEDHGEAWYVNPSDGKRYFLGRPADAFSIMRQLGLGISNDNLALIPTKSLLQTQSQPGYFSISFPQNMSKSTTLEDVLEKLIYEGGDFTDGEVVAYWKDEDLPALTISRVTVADEVTLDDIALKVLSDDNLLSLPKVTTLNDYPALSRIEEDLLFGEHQYVTIVEVDAQTYYIVNFVFNASDGDLYRDLYYNEIEPSLYILK